MSRLPKSVLPKCYYLELWIDLNSCIFEGALQIDVHVVESTCTILLNSTDLILSKESIYLHPRDSAKEIIHATTCNMDQENELLVLHFATLLPVGEFTLCLNYQGVLNEKLDSFYRSIYHIGGLPKNMAVTVFEPADARRCFPCWDEPDFKACFKFRVHAPCDRIVLSNMPVVREYVSSGDTKVVEFQKSPPMSTYLVAIVIGEFEYMEVLSEDDVLVRVYTLPGELHKGKFGFDIMLKLLPFYARFFQLRYPLPKLDIVSVPTFKAGALEEFGLIVFRDTALFIDDNSSSSQKQHVAINVAHEVAHMWFGNLVTLEWWTHIWLNEGMATWISYMAVNYLFPDWNIWMEFHKEIMHGMTLDAYQETHPVEVEVVHARETMEVFDAIGYCKGASMVYMLQHYLGLEDLQRGLILYMQRFAFGNATSDDLWDCLHEVTKKPIKELMYSWTKQKGYPILKVTLLNDYELHMQQSQFCADGQAREGQWIIPITFCSGKSYDFHQSMLLEKQKCIISIPSQILKLNFEQRGFYRVHYDNQLLAALKDSIALGSLTALDRLGVLDDMFALCQSGKEPFSALLSLLKVYRNESDPTVLSKMIDVALNVSRVMVVAIPSLLQKTNYILSKLLETAARELGWEAMEDEIHLKATLREKVLYGLVMLDHEETILEAQKRYKNKSVLPLASNILKATYMSMMKDTTSMNRDGYDGLLGIYRSSDNSEERNQALGIIGATFDLELLLEALNFSLSSEVRPQDMSLILRGVHMNGGLTCWNWLKGNWNAVYDKLGDGFLIRNIVHLVTSKLWSHDVVEDVRETICSHISSFKHLGDECGEKVKLTTLWIDHIRSDKDFLWELNGS